MTMTHSLSKSNSLNIDFQNYFSASRRRILASISILLFSFAIIVPGANAQDDIDGAAIFKKTCTQCHTIGKGKLTGPDLKDAHKRVPQPHEEWMVPWIQNSQAVIKAGDAYAIKIFEEYNKTLMTTNPLSDEEALAVIQYIVEESAKETTTAGAVADNPYEPAPEEEPDNTSDYILLAFGAIFLTLIFILGSVGKSLKRLVAERQGSPEPIELSAIGSLKQWMGSNKRVVAVIIIVLIAYGSKQGWNAMLYLDVQQGYEPEQPIWFSHKVHAGTNGINCVYCHSGAEKGKTAGIPSANVCMNCHKAIKDGTFTGDKEIPKIYAALDYDVEKQTYGENTTPINWIRVHSLADFAYFNHSQHVVVGQVECQTCHGPVEEMHVMRQESMLTMGWCIDCHRKTEVKMEGNEYYTELHAKLVEKHQGEKITVDKMGGIDCARCHY